MWFDTDQNKTSENWRHFAMDTTNAPQIFEHIQESLNFTPYDTKWLPYSCKFVLSGQTPRMKGILKFMTLEQSSVKELSSVELGTGVKGTCFNYYHSSSVPGLAVAEMSGKLYTFDVEKQKVSWEVQAHEGMTNCVDSVGGVLGKGAVELVSGGRDGKVKLWDPRQSSPVLVLEPPKDGNLDCWTVGLGNAHSTEDRAIACGFDNGDVKLFDLRRNSLIWDANIKNGVCGLEFDRRDIKMNKLAVGTLEGMLHCFDLRTWHPEAGFAAASHSVQGKPTLWGIKHLPQNREIFASLGGDGTVRLHLYKYPPQRALDDGLGKQKGVAGSLELLNDRKIAEQPVVAWDWNNDKLGLAVSAALDQTLKIVIVTRLQSYA